MKTICTILLFYVCYVDGSRKFPTYISRCSRNDPDLNACFLDKFNEVTAKIDMFSKDLAINVDPYMIEKISVSLGNDTSKLDITVSDVKLFGLNDVKAQSAHIDLSVAGFGVEYTIPFIRMTGRYRGKGKILLFQIDSSGLFNANCTKLQGKVQGVGKIKTVNGQRYVKYEDMDVKISIKDINIYISDLLPTKELSDNLNAAINANMEFVYGEMEPIILATVRSSVIGLLNRFHGMFSIEELYPE